MDPARDPEQLPAHCDDAGAPFSVPGGYSIACRVLEQWVAQPLQSATEQWEGTPVPDAVVSQAAGEFKYMLLEVCAMRASAVQTAGVQVAGVDAATSPHWSSGSLCPCKVQTAAGDGVEQNRRETDVGDLTVLQVSTSVGRHSKLVVRGDERAPYHRDVISHAERELSPLGLVVAQRGGGWVRATSDGALVLYGESSRFGAADHNVAAELIRRAHPFWSVSVTTDC